MAIKSHIKQSLYLATIFIFSQQACCAEKTCFWCCGYGNVADQHEFKAQLLGDGTTKPNLTTQNHEYPSNTSEESEPSFIITESENPQLVSLTTKTTSDITTHNGTIFPEYDDVPEEEGSSLQLSNILPRFKAFLESYTPTESQYDIQNKTYPECIIAPMKKPQGYMFLQFYRTKPRVVY